jgi:diacylglycerol O-acyltransferase / wax synthase
VTGDGRLNALEAGFLWMETDVQPLHVGSVLIFEGPAPDHHEFCERIAGRLAPAPWHRRRAQRMPLDLGRPIWVDSEHFAVGEHLHHAVLDPPGDDAQLRAMVLWIMAERLDVGRPMWEMWQVDGLSGGRWAVIAKAHHAMVDGRSGTDVVQSVLDPEQSASGAGRPAVRPVTGPRALRPSPSPGDLAVSGATWLLSLPFRLIRLLLRAVLSPGEARHAIQQVRAGLAAVVRPDLPPSILNGPLSGERLWGWTGIDRAPLADLRAATGCTVNDIFLTALTGGLRRYLLDRGEPLEAMVLRTIVPVSGRREAGSSAPTNETSAMFVNLPVEIADPGEQLAVVMQCTAEQKSHGVASGTDAVVRLADHIPAPLLARASRKYVLAGQARVNVAATNVPGPREVRHLGGRQLLEFLPYIPVALDVRCTFALVSYADRLAIGVTADAVALPDMDRLVVAVGVSLDALAEVSRSSRPVASATI